MVARGHPCYDDYTYLRRPDIRSLSMLLPYLKRYRISIALGLGSMILATGFSRLIPWMIKLAIDTLKSESGNGEITHYIGLMVAAALAGAVFLYVQRLMIASSSRRIEYDFRKALFGHVQRLDLDFFQKKKIGDLMALFTNDIGAIGTVSGPGIMYAFSTVIILVMSIALMVAISPFLTLVAFAPFPVITVITFFFARAMLVRSRRVQDLFGVISSRAEEDLAGMRVIRAYGQQENVSLNFNNLSSEYLEANMSVSRLRGRFLGTMSALAGTGLAIALLVGGRMVMKGELSLGSLVAFSVYLSELTWPVIAIGWVMSIIQRGASAAARLETVFSSSPSVKGGPQKGRPAPHLCFENVSFRYPGATRDAIENISFQLAPGQTLGIVGRTGGGKSTVLKLVQRFFDPNAGRILLDGIDIRERDLDQVRAITGYAPQDAFLFSRSIAENIAYGDTEASRLDIEHAAEQAKFLKDTEGFPEGLDAMVGERGITLSGGQRQRASLARALLVKPELLLLDATLSSVDAETEKEILAELREYMANRTSIITSHRISAVQHADLILVLVDGRVVEEGTHAFLIEQGGMYARIYERQRLAAEIEGVG